ncbi:MAG: ferrochelatase [Acetobacteraceae bacterium]
MPAERVAIVLFNLGGPDSPAAIAPFLRNLFADPAILRLPFFLRWPLARIIAGRRRKPATAIYALLGGRSPLLDLTREQARALEAALPEVDARCFIAMRYWHPNSDEAARAVVAFAPDHVVLLPLYPQFSTTTTGSSLTAWREAAARAGLVATVTTLCCWPDQAGYAAATAALARRTWEEARAKLGGAPMRLLFSAHGLPQAIVRAGDPYAWQVARTAAAILGAWEDAPDDWTICYQSRATPQKWLEPSTDQEIARAARDKVAVVVVPIAFVSDHSETLVELDIEYRHLAEKLGVAGYFRVPAQNDDPGFIAALADIVRRARTAGPGLCSDAGRRLCPREFGGCPFA